MLIHDDGYEVRCNFSTIKLQNISEKNFSLLVLKVKT